MMRHPCKYYNTCKVHCNNGRPKVEQPPKKVKPPKTKSCFVPQNIIMPCYACTRYDTELRMVAEEKRFRRFQDANGKSHQCIKFFDGRWVKCGKLVLL